MIDLIPRNLLPISRDILQTFPILMVQGARQVGKSTFSQLLAPEDGRQFTLDDEATLHLAMDDPKSFVTQYPGSTLIIDEIQRAPQLLLAIKAEVDRDRRPGRFVLTGSSNPLSLAKTPDSMAGRAITVRLRGLSQGELVGRVEDFAAWTRDLPASPQDFSTEWTREDYVSAIARGGYPEVRDLSPRMRGLWLDNYVERLLSRDLADVSGRLDDVRARDVLHLIAANQGGELVKARLGSALGISPSSIGTYLQALKTMYLVDEIRPWTGNLTAREVGRRKAALSDSALAMRLAGIREQSLASPSHAEHFGSLLEAFAVSELLKQQAWSDEEFDIYHFRDRNGLEVDVVIEFADGRVFLLEIKASQTFKRTHTEGIRTLAEKLGPRFLGGAVLGLSSAGQLLGEKIYGLPLSILWEA